MKHVAGLIARVKPEFPICMNLVLIRGRKTSFFLCFYKY